MLFGFTEAQVAAFGMSFGLASFMLYMLFVVAKLAKDSNAGKTGTIVLFFVLAFGMLGFLAKALIQKVLGL